MTTSQHIIKILDEKKAKEIKLFDLKDKNYLVDEAIVATSLNEKHSLSLVDSLKEGLKPLGEEFLRVDDGQGWIVIDLGDKLIHIMIDEYRQRYDMDQFLQSFKASS
ncbi:MAG: ribosome silencing factor [Campylobacteraceae bacterium 4484_166]|nr:MAG: ribosome silencing factor [Campylobacteraceae bacterium 4484_166]